MELVYLGIVIFLFALSTFDLFVGVSNAGRFRLGGRCE